MQSSKTKQFDITLIKGTILFPLNKLNKSHIHSFRLFYLIYRNSMVFCIYSSSYTTKSLVTLYPHTETALLVLLLYNQLAHLSRYAPFFLEDFCIV